MQLAEPAGIDLPSIEHARGAPGMEQRDARRARSSAARRRQRFEVALDVEEVDGARAARPIAPAARRRTRARRGAAAARSPARRAQKHAADLEDANARLLAR